VDNFCRFVNKLSTCGMVRASGYTSGAAMTHHLTLRTTAQPAGSFPTWVMAAAGGLDRSAPWGVAV